MGPANTLSHKDNLDTSSDNHASSIVPESIVINALDLILSQSIAHTTPSDPLILCIISALQDDSPLFSCSSLSDWHFDNGYLYFKGRMYVPPTAHSSLLHSLHSSPSFSHMGIFCTKAILECDFWWPGLASFVKSFIDGCAVCQQNKVNTHPTILPLVPIPSLHTLLFKQLSVNLIMDLPPSDGHDSVVVIVDHGLMKGVIQTPCSKTIDAIEIAQIFFNNVFKHFGLHDILISDCGPQFASAFAKKLARLLKYDMQLSTAYHPQTNGQIEQTNQELKMYLHIFCTNNPISWAQFLSTAEFHHNFAPHSSTKKSPFSLLYGYEPCSYPPLRKTFLPALETQLTILDKAQKEALAAHESARKLMMSRSTC